jgi:hypothetical protein
VAIRGVPMGWVNSVDLIQNFIRKFVFPLAKLIRAGKSGEIEGCLSPRPPLCAWTALTSSLDLK